MEKRKKLLPFIVQRENSHVTYNDERYTVRIPKDINKKYTVPMKSTITCKLEWFAGVCDSDGCITKNDSNLSIQVCSIKEDFLKNTRLMLQTIGVDSKITVMSLERERFMPTHQKAYRLLLSSFEVSKLLKLGFTTHRLDFSNFKEPNRDTSQYVKVDYIENIVELSDTYCFNEPKRHLGMFNGILTGNCNEISLYSDSTNYSVCNLASICLPKFVENGVFNFEKLQHIAGIITNNLNNVIDVNYYPTPECKKTNISNRPIGIGVQGLSDVYFMLKLPFGSKAARELNKKIFENIYFGAVKKSVEMSERFGKYESMDLIHKDGIITSPHKKGLLQFNLWLDDKVELTLDWKPLLERLKEHGIHNSLLTAIMPTASTSQICGNYECVEPVTSNIYVRKTLSGEFTLVNHHLVKELIKLNLWNDEIRDEIMYDNGSIQKIHKIPAWLREIYKTAYEVKMTDILNQAIDRSPFVDHQQSMNLFMKTPNMNSLNSSHFYSWKHGLKTGMYYLRTQPASDATKFGIDPSAIKRIKQERNDLAVEVNAKFIQSQACPKDDYLKSLCDSCSS
jgi:ribonucleoside-diphosphate reductase alpha chain